MTSSGTKSAKNICSLAEKLGLKCRLVRGTHFFEYQKQAGFIPQNILDVFGNAMDTQRAEELVIAKENYPQLYEIIISEGKKDANRHSN